MKKNIDVIRYLNDNNITYTTYGKNVKKGEINIRCPNCQDTTNHLRIKPSGWLECWKCGNWGPFTKLIEYVQKIDWKEAKEIVKKYETSNIIIPDKREIEYVETFKMPYGIDNYLHKIHKDYLENRGFDVNELILKYKLKSCLSSNPKFQYRIVIPIYLENKLINFVARDVTGKQDPKYKDCPEELVAIPKRELLYNFDSVEEGGTGILVEGPADVWNIGDGCFGSLTTNFSIGQVNLMRKKRLKRLFIFYDNKFFDENAGRKAEEIEKMLYFIPEIYYIDFMKDIKDPGDLPRDDVRSLRSQIF